MEMADCIIINKADGDIDKANLRRRSVQERLASFPPSESGWFLKVLTSFRLLQRRYPKENMDMVEKYMEFTKRMAFNYKRNEQAKYWMYESINDTLRDKFLP